jgi:phenylpyruvate tautomerase PptA (4-oxalocrotonate tautomerase family)
MPYSRISLLKGKSPDYLRALADSLHYAMVETFNVPETDRFQVIHQHEPHELIFDRSYELAPGSSGPRSDDFVLIAITTGKPRSTAVKQAFYQRLADRLGVAPGLRPEDLMVVINTALGDEWSMSGGRPVPSLLKAMTS